MAIGYLGLRYIELSISSPICNSSGAIVAVLVLATDGVGSSTPLQLAAVACVCLGVVALGVTEATEDEDLRKARQDEANRHYAKSWIAITIPIIYCLLDALGTFADSRVLMHLFGVTPDDIQVVVHPQSVVHSMVELEDGTVIAQLGVADMETLTLKPFEYQRENL